ncbi:NAD(P)-binding domain-containing protein [Nocardia sp. NPDC006630]|uniref:NAD(P)-dependent oxidoreductase n=1 Tax=Nocardia sp. NPDC006630 TaxID=3157181 RepID=UPI0033B0030D
MTALTVGFIGAGRIGEPMVERLLAAGHRVRLYARRPEVRNRLAALGAEPVALVRDIAAADIVVSCLFGDDQISAVLPEVVAAMPEGAILLSHTTGTPDALDGLDRFAPNGRGATIVEASFSGTPEAVRAGELVVFLGGAPGDIATARRVVGCYAGTVIATGGRGSALRVKLLNNLLFAAVSQLTLQSLAAGRGLGIEEGVLLEVLSISSGGSTAGRYIAARGGSESFTAAVAPFLRKDVAACRDALGATDADIGTLLAAACTGPIDLGAVPTLEKGVVP